MRKSKARNIEVGKTIGNYTVVRREANYRLYWCRCSCGREKPVWYQYLCGIMDGVYKAMGCSDCVPITGGRNRWVPDEKVSKVIGKIKDAEVARMAGVGLRTVIAYRKANSIPSIGRGRPRKAGGT